MRAQAFFAREPVFTLDEFAAAHPNGRTAAAKLLEYHARVGHVVSVRRGLYVVVPAGSAPDALDPDTYLLASRLFASGAVSHVSALALYLGRPAPRELTAVSPARSRPVELFSRRYVPVLAPRAIREVAAEEGIATIAHAGGTTRVTTRERTVVDLLDTPTLGGGWKRLWRDLDAFGDVDATAVAELALLRASPVLAGRVGYWLETRARRDAVPDKALTLLERAAPSSPVRLDRASPGRLARRWRLVVPEWLEHDAAERVAALPTEVALSPDARAILAVLETEQKTVDELCAATSLPPSAMLTTLLQLELAGLARRRGPAYVRTDARED